MTTASKRRPSRSRASAVSAVQPGRSAFAPDSWSVNSQATSPPSSRDLALARLALRGKRERRVLLVGGRQAAVEREASQAHVSDPHWPGAPSIGRCASHPRHTRDRSAANRLPVHRRSKGGDCPGPHSRAPATPGRDRLDPSPAEALSPCAARGGCSHSPTDRGGGSRTGRSTNPGPPRARSAGTAGPRGGRRLAPRPQTALPWVEDPTAQTTAKCEWPRWSHE